MRRRFCHPLTILAGLVAALSTSEAFVAQRWSSEVFVTKLYAKKAKRSSGTGGGGGGFGAPKKASTKSKVRSVSGFTGSGTKPLRVAANTYDKLRTAYGKDACRDIYARSPANDPELFWFVGKVAWCNKEEDLEGASIPTPEEAVISQRRLILEYSKRQLRPTNLGGPFSEGLDVWLAPADSEMDVVQNKISLQKVKGSLKDLSEGFAVADVGYGPEIYVGEEISKGGLRVVRDENGDPVKGVFEVNESL
eukprot:CAMPEP_0194030566 /NCGR_PEP_ID=MMETSP0009_2-20130614/4001_1 /TAXON_ID=210454 /ORGANISM="Grammatophora oceanica, Strain CCMP 410" /LENGTH=249 /DNA_ID=CAMNT_0038670531 /DNA_START=18 /DNA_END=767 /DNA_ORIENTATION=+